VKVASRSRNEFFLLSHVEFPNFWQNFKCDPARINENEIAQKRLAQNLLSQGMEVEQVAELTELSLEEVRKLMTSN